MLQVFAINRVTATFDGRRQNKGVVEAQAMSTSERDRASVAIGCQRKDVRKPETKGLQRSLNDDPILLLLLAQRARKLVEDLRTYETAG